MSSAVANQMDQRISLMPQADVYEIISLFKKKVYLHFSIFYHIYKFTFSILIEFCILKSFLMDSYF